MISRIIGGVCVLFLMPGCNSDAPPTQGKLLTFDTVCDKDNEGKRVSLEGFLNFPGKFNAKAPLIVMRLQSAPTRTSKGIGVSLKLNAGTNTVEAPPDKYNERDLKATTWDRKTVYYNTRVKVTGEMSYSNSLDSLGFNCLIVDTRIELAGAVAPN